MGGTGSPGFQPGSATGTGQVPPFLEGWLTVFVPEKAEGGLFTLNTSRLDGFITLHVLSTKGLRLPGPQHHHRDGFLS